ncbi:MAG: hydrogenase iron-sulfur subunit [Candidatus Humimicrobiaceae bacterium]
MDIEQTAIKEEKKGSEFEPLILAFCCNWCSYAGADLAGISRMQYPTNVRIIRVMCSGMIHSNLVIDALTKGADGVIICGCHIGDCHYLEGNLKAEKRADAIRLMLEDFGIEDGRFKLEWISASEGPRFAQVMTEFTEAIKKLGPSPYKM